MAVRRDTGQPTSGPSDAREHLARLGLDPGANRKQIADAYIALVAYLSSAPGPVRPWARRQRAEVEAAYAALGHTSARAREDQRAAGPAPDRFIASDADDAEELFDALDDSPHPAPRLQRTRTVIRATPDRSGMGARFTRPADDGMRRLALGAGALAIAAVAIVAVYKLGEPTVPGLTGTPVPAATAAGIDEARVVALMEQLTANPQDVAALRELADLYYAAGDSATSRTWLLKVLAIDPDNIEALLGAGATAYNLDDFKAAEEAWRAVLAIDPKNIDAHYDLGLMYFSMDPPDLVRMREAWNTVIALAPDSQLASIVKTHMPDAGSSAGPSEPAASGAPSSAPASPSAAPVASPG